MLKFKTAVLASVLSLGLVPSAEAISIDYTVRLDVTLNGSNPLTVAILEWDGASQATFSGFYDVTPTGVQTISHDAAFQPVKTLILGVDYGVTAADNHVVMFMNPEFAALALGVGFRDTFSGTPYHNGFRITAASAMSGSDAAQAWLLDWAFGVSSGNEAGALGGVGLTAQGIGAAFAPGGPNVGVEFSAGVPTTVPEPTSLILLGTGLALGARRLRKRRRTE